MRYLSEKNYIEECFKIKMIFSKFDVFKKNTIFGMFFERL